ncbi:hypothetical protein ACQ4LE_003719 [Meloidogyne hapla]
MDNNNGSEITSEFTIATTNTLEQNFFKGLSFLAENSFGDNLDNLSPFKPESSFTSFKSPMNCLKLFPRLWSSNKRQLSTPIPKTPILQLSPSYKLGLMPTPKLVNIKQEEQSFEPKTPFPRKKATKVIKRLLYEDRPTYYLVVFETTNFCNSQQWLHKEKARPYIVKLIEEFEFKLSKDKKLAEDLTEYEVEAILDRTLCKNIYLVRWVGWKDPTWEKRHYLLPKYESLLSQFDAYNDQCLPIGGEGILINQNIRVIEAIKVISKLDRGDSGQPNSYLLEWPKGSDRVYTEGSEKVQSWEDKISLGNKKAIEKFERSLKRGVKAAKEAVQFEVECIENRHRKSKEIEYLVKWRGYDKHDWIQRNELLNCCQNLVKKYEINRLDGKRKTTENSHKFNRLKNTEIPKELIIKFKKIGRRLNRRMKKLRNEQIRKRRLVRQKQQIKSDKN